MLRNSFCLLVMRRFFLFVFIFFMLSSCWQRNQQTDTVELPQYVWMDYKHPNAGFSVTLPSYLLQNVEEGPDSVVFSGHGVTLIAKAVGNSSYMSLSDLHQQELDARVLSNERITYDASLRNAFVISGYDQSESNIFYKRVVSASSRGNKNVYSIEVSYPKSLSEHGKEIISYFRKFPSGNSKKYVENNTLSAQSIFKKCSPAVFSIITEDENGDYYQGSGFLISPDGIAVSNYHVFAGTLVGKERIELPDQSLYEVSSVDLIDKDNDIVVFKLLVPDNTILPYIPIARGGIQIGDTIYTIGNPRGLNNTFSSGEISQFRTINGSKIIQINAPIDHGSSGGALLNDRGEAIGITTGGLDDSGANLNFAVDIRSLQL